MSQPPRLHTRHPEDMLRLAHSACSHAFEKSQVRLSFRYHISIRSQSQFQPEHRIDTMYMFPTLNLQSSIQARRYVQRLQLLVLMVLGPRHCHDWVLLSKAHSHVQVTLLPLSGLMQRLLYQALSHSILPGHQIRICLKSPIPQPLLLQAPVTCTSV